MTRGGGNDRMDSRFRGNDKEERGNDKEGAGMTKGGFPLSRE